MMSKLLVSIIVPCFNQGQYLGETLQSVLDQTYSNWECLIVNDGSNDNTEEIAKKWCALDSRFSYYNKENGGLSSARNFGISKASGIYILPLDSDDKIECTYLQKAIKAFKEDNELKLVYCRVSYFGAKEIEWVLDPYSFNELLINNMIFCSAVFKKEDFIKIKGYSENLKFGLEDWDLWIRLLNPNGKVFKIPEILFFYRKHYGTSMSDKFNNLENHNYTMNIIFDNNREIYNGYFENPIKTAWKCVRYQKKIAKIEKSKFYNFELKVKEILRMVKSKMNKY